MMEQNHASAWGWALCCCKGSKDDAFEVLQTSYLKLLEGTARYEGRSSFRTWLFGVIRKTAQKRERSILTRLQKLSSLGVRTSQASINVEENLYRSELREKIEALLRQLSTRQRQVLQLVFYHDLTVEESAEVIGVSVGSARTHYQRGKDRLRKEIRKAGLRGRERPELGNRAAF